MSHSWCIKCKLLWWWIHVALLMSILHVTQMMYAIHVALVMYTCLNRRQTTPGATAALPFVVSFIRLWWRKAPLLKTSDQRVEFLSEFLDRKYLLFGGTFPSPLLTENHSAHKSLAELGSTPTPLHGKILLSRILRLPF